MPHDASTEGSSSGANEGMKAGDEVATVIPLCIWSASVDRVFAHFNAVSIFTPKTTQRQLNFEALADLVLRLALIA